jgi:hypothetical protein
MKMKKNLLVFTVTIFILSACGVPATPALEPTMTMPSVSTSVPLSTVTSATSDTSSQYESPYGITNHLDKFEALGNGYILYGNLSWTDPLIPPYGASAQLASVKDANRKEIPFEYAEAGIYPDQGELRQYWAFELSETNLATPLSLSFVVVASLPVNGGSFTFDPGPNPKLGQKWEINQDVIVNNETVHILSVEEAGIEEGYFLFTMQSNSNIVSATITDFEHPPVGGGGGGGGIPEAGVPFRSGFGYQIPLPQGPFTLTFTNVGILVPGDWTLTWMPPKPASISEDAVHCYIANLPDSTNHPCSVEQLESILGFNIRKPTLNDPRLVFSKAYWNGPSADVTQADLAGFFYKCPNDECNLFITQVLLVSVDNSNIIDWGKIPSSAVEIVDLKEGIGEYVKGWFFQAEPREPEVWSPDLETQRLAWVLEDVLFTIALDGNSSVESIEKTDLIEIANSME